MVLILPAFGLNTYLFVFSPNVGKYGPEKTPHLDTFHAVPTYSMRGGWGKLVFEKILLGKNEINFKPQ